MATHGMVTPDKFASLAVLRADPSRAITDTTKIDFVVKHGRIYTREARQ